MKKIYLLLMSNMIISCGPLNFENIPKTPPKHQSNPTNAVGGFFESSSESSFYVFGGIRKGKSVNKILKYNKPNNLWTELSTTLPVSVADASISRNLDGKHYMLGGRYIYGMETTFDTQSNLIEISLNGNSINIAPLEHIPNEGNLNGIAYHSTTIIDNNLYVFGGKRSASSNSQSNYNMNIYRYNITDSVWSNTNIELFKPVINGYIIHKYNYIYVINGEIDPDTSKFTVQIFNYSNNTISYFDSFEIDPINDMVNGLPYVYTRDTKDFNQFYYYPINGNYRIFIENFNPDIDRPSSDNNFYFRIEYSDFNFPNELMDVRSGTTIHGNFLGSDWLILTPNNNFYATPN